MTTSSQEVSFADATAVKATSSHTYEANFPNDWCIGSGKIHSSLSVYMHVVFNSCVWIVYMCCQRGGIRHSLLVVHFSCSECRGSRASASESWYHLSPYVMSSRRRCLSHSRDMQIQQEVPSTFSYMGCCPSDARIEIYKGLAMLQDHAIQSLCASAISSNVSIYSDESHS